MPGKLPSVWEENNQLRIVNVPLGPERGSQWILS